MTATGEHSHRLNLIAEAAAMLPDDKNKFSPEVYATGGINSSLYPSSSPSQPFIQGEVIQFTKNSRRSGGMSVVHTGGKKKWGIRKK